MAVESERSPYPGGTGGGPKAAQDDVPTSFTRRSASENGMRELPRSTIKSHGHPFVSQLPKPSHTTTPGVSGPSSTTNSATPSRESSPSHSSQRPRNSSSTSTSRVSSRSRKRPLEPSPDRSDTKSPSPGPGKPSKSKKPLVLSPPTNVEPSSDAPSPDKSNMPSWVGSRRSEQELHLPNTSSKRTQAGGEEYATTKSDRSAPRSVNRGVNGSGSALETVQEASDHSTPSTDTILLSLAPEDAKLDKIDEDATPKASRIHTESGSDSGGNKSSEQMEENRRRPSFASKGPNSIIPKRSTTSLSGGSRTKPADGSVRNMIVETETVSSIPQVGLGVGTVDRGGSGRVDPGTLRMKPSTETIRPKKEKKRARKPAALTSGAASSKADIFEAKVASAVDEADVSDSDETFVYESNPPDQYPVRQSRYHSRTPSATSMASQVDQLAGRSRPALREGNHSVTGKRSMKFTNNTYTSSVDGDADEAPRSHSRIDGSGTHTPRHHVGRHGRQNMYPSLFDNESPFPQSQGNKSPRHFIGSAYRQSRQPGSRNSQNYRTINSYKKAGEVYGYDFDAEGADDERTPLVRSPRQVRNHGGRRPNSASIRQIEYLQQRHRSCLSRYGACVLISLLFFLLVGGGTSFIVAITKPLVDVQVLEIQNVLASEQELMLDLNVEAVNPNIFPVVVDNIDVNIFAKSRYVGTEQFWRDYGPDDARLGRAERRKRADITRTARCAGDIDCENDYMVDQMTRSHGKGGGVDKGTDPIPSDPAGDQQTMLIGRVFRLDSTLTFEASPWNHEPSTSKGQIRLARPGNGTEKGGTERWERVLQHPFELIVAGVVKYQLPLSSRFHSSSISSSIKWTPDDGGDDDNGDKKHKKDETVSISMTQPFRRDLPNTVTPEGETLRPYKH
ncbi:putative phospholipid metabolism enzyme regulator [Aspergillus undulatus]|uniref:putative phospholipid metabolism enzyme regulator n=1 Tax=Aspergillus undulatus TaxID=1810928 RepID=UPI003CCE20EC